MALALHPISQCLQEFPEMALTNKRGTSDLLAREGKPFKLLRSFGDMLHLLQKPQRMEPRWQNQTNIDGRVTTQV